MQSWTEESSRLFRVRKTVLQMLNDRGYRVLPEDLEESIEDFRSKFGDTPSREGLTLLHSHSVTNSQIFVFFPTDDKLGQKAVREYVNKMKGESVEHGIFVVKEGLTPSAKSSLSTQGVRLEAFTEGQLLVNITEHELVPQHIPLSKEEKGTLLQRYKLKENQLPRILIDDPVARHFGLIRGDVVKIIRNSETAGRYVTYRLCV
ncbi:hypothetical protein P9112_003584 [Eukaryota sp. TZLM1-RC]